MLSVATTRRRRRSAASSMIPLPNRKIAALAGEANTLRSGFSASRPMSPTGIVPTTSSHPRRASVSSARTSRSRSDRTMPLAIRFQSAQEEDEQHERRRQVRRDEEGEEEVVVLVDVPAEDARQDHAVAERGDRERLGDALEQPEDRRLEVADGRLPAQATSWRADGPV